MQQRSESMLRIAAEVDEKSVHHKGVMAFFVGSGSGFCRAKSFPQRLVEC